MTELVEIPDAPEAAFHSMWESGWTDGLPVIPPSRGLVDAMIAGAGAAADMEIAPIPPSFRVATVESIAVNAAMAGCLPEYLPVVIAAVRAMCRAEFNLYAITTTTSPVGPGILVNGPVAKQLGLNSGEGSGGPGDRPNMSIGRALRLILLNIGGAVPGQLDRAMVGSPAKIAYCVAENEDASPWEPFHVSRGLSVDQSSVTVVSVNNFVCAWPPHVSFPGVASATATLDSMANVMMNPHYEHISFGLPVAFIVPPANAKLMADAGFTREKAQQYLWQKARLPVASVPNDGLGWHPEPAIVDGEFLAVRQPSDIVLFVAGGLDYTTCVYLGGWDNRFVVEAI